MKKYLSITLTFLFFGIISVVAADAYVFSNNLQVGSLGQEVSNLQTWLIQNGYDIPAISSGRAIKGNFGAQTKLAVQKYQTKLGLPPTGFVGPLTRAKLNGQGNNADLSFKIISPNMGESWQRGSIQNIAWNAPQYIRATYVDIQLEYPLPACAQPGQPVQCMIAVMAPITIARSVSIDTHSFSWKVGDAFSYGVYLPVFPSSPSPAVPDGQYTVKICQVGTDICAVTDKLLTIYTSSTTPSSNNPIIITDPSSQENLFRGSTKTIRWATLGSPSLVSIYLDKYTDSIPCPAGYSCPQMAISQEHYLIEQIPNPAFYNNKYDWLVGTATMVAPEKNTTKYPEDGKYKIRICRDETGVDNNTGKCDYTDSYITITTDTTCPKGYVCINNATKTQ